MRPVNSPFLRKPPMQPATMDPQTDLAMARNDLGIAVAAIAIRYRLSDQEAAALLVDELGIWMKQAQG